MEEKLVTLAILTYSKAEILKGILESEGIEAYIHNVNLIQPVISGGVRVRIKESDLPHALKIVENSKWLEEVVEDQEDEEEAKKMHKVLIPIDFSEYSMKACEFGFDFAAQMKTDVVLLHTYFSPIYVPAIQYDGVGVDVPMEQHVNIKSMIESVNEELNKFVETLKSKISAGELPDVKFSCILRDGIPEEEILSYSKDYKPILIVMGTRGKGKKELDLIGSVTAEVIERSRSFVYAIPEDTPLKSFKQIKRVAFATSFDQRDLIAFDSLITTFNSYNFAISFIHLGAHEEKKAWSEIKLAGIKEYFQKQYPQLEISYEVVPEDHLLTQLDEYMKKENIDVLCITNYKRNVFARLFNPSIARRMLFHATTPILIIK